MKMFCIVFLLLTPGVCEDDDDDVKYISKRNSGRMTAITWNISFAFKEFIVLSFMSPLFYSALSTIELLSFTFELHVFMLGDAMMNC